MTTAGLMCGAGWKGLCRFCDKACTVCEIDFKKIWRSYE